ncbi:hypothetical protein PybrP1_003927 [[Pythium] brassicae (nom. inval.)]|nr:hypothetical protein PybrP1_003927 [[Pythium] brassicae (nom. inval.)]
MDFNVFSPETLDRSASQRVRDAVAAAAASFSMLFVQQAVMKHTLNDFWTLGALLLAVFCLQAGVAFVGAAADPRKRSAAALALALDARTAPKLLANGARIFAQCWVRADALHHFGFLFAFLLENAGVLLLQPLKDALRPRATGDSSSSTTWLLVLLGYVLVAGVDAYEYGSLLHTLVLIALALAAQEAHDRTPETRVRASAAPYFHLLSLLCASALSAPLALVIGSWRVRDEAAFNAREGMSPMGAAAWTGCLFVAAACQSAALHFTRPHGDTARGRWMAVMACSATGLIGSLLVSASQDDWLRCAADALASLVILTAQFLQLRRASAGRDGDDNELGVFHAGSNDGERASASVLRILRVLWAADDSRKILLFLSVNVSYMFVELVVGFWTNSLGLIGDAGHMLFDNGALVIGLVASYIGKLPADAQYTYGYGRVEVLSGFLNSIFLLVVSFHLMAEAASRFVDPPEVSTDNLLLTSTVGLGVNIVGLVWFHDTVHGHGHSHGGDGGGCGGGGGSSAHGHSHGHGHAHGHRADESDASSSSAGGSNSNMYGVYLHVLADTLGSVGVIVSSILIELKGWHIADPLSSAMISVLIFGSTLPLLKDTLLQLLQRVPREMEHDVAATLDEVRASVSGLVAVEQWHFWRHVNDVCVGTLHVAVDDGANEQLVLQQIRAIFKRRLKLDGFLSIQVSKSGFSGQLTHGGGGVHHHHHHHDHHDDHHHHDDHRHHSDHYHLSTGLSTFENPAGDDALLFASHHHTGFVKPPTAPIAAFTPSAPAAGQQQQQQSQWRFDQRTPHTAAATAAPARGFATGNFLSPAAGVQHGDSTWKQRDTNGHNHGHSHGHSH